MKKQNNKYLFIDYSNIRKIYNKEIVKKDAKIIFDKNLVPEQYQKIILKINIPNLFMKNEAEEYLTKIAFDITGYTRLKKTDNPKIVCGRSITNSTGFADSNDFIEFQTPLDFKTEKDLETFFKELSDNDLLRPYIISTIQFLTKLPMKNEIETIKKRFINKK